MLIFLVHATSRMFVYLDFVFHQEYIAKNLCVNRDKPMMHCDGKCYLHKEMQKNDEQSSSQTAKSPVLELIFTSQQAVKLTKIQPHFILKQSLADFSFQEPFSLPAVKSIFHPPLSQVA